LANGALRAAQPPRSFGELLDARAWREALRER
jgi:hypothetical protein